LQVGKRLFRFSRASSLTISAKPDGVGAVSQLWTRKDAQSGLLMRIAAPVKRSVVRADDKLITFIELEAAIRDVWVSDAVASR
jgi:hypothetical protein